MLDMNYCEVMDELTITVLKYVIYVYKLQK